MITEVASPESSRVESTIIGPETISKGLDDRISPAQRTAIPLTRAAASNLVVSRCRPERCFDLIKVSGSPRYSAPIRELASNPDNKTASSGYFDVANRLDARNRTPIMG